jgi:hypothetical protein
MMLCVRERQLPATELLAAAAALAAGDSQLLGP